MRFVLFLFALISILAANAQQALEGIVVNDQQQPLPGASVSLLKASDSSLLKLTVTKKDGSFRILTVEKNFIVKIAAIGYEQLLLTQVNSRKIVLQPAVNQLQNVRVTSARPLYQFLSDKTVLNIDAAPSNAGNSLLEVLNKIPDVITDESGNISLNGKPGVLILVDGRETYLSGAALINYLRTTPSAGADQIEVISNPSAKYEATATGGIINIKTKKNLKEGLNALFTNTTGIVIYNDVDDHAKSARLQTTNLNWNYRKNKINLYGNVGYDRSFYFENFKTTRRFYDQNTKAAAGSYFSWSHLKAPADNYQIKAAADYTVNKNHLVGVIINTSFGNSSATGETNSRVMNNKDQIEYLMRSSISNPTGKDYTGNYNLNHKYVTSNKNAEINSDVSYLDFNSSSLTDNQTAFFDTLNNTVHNTLFRQQQAQTNFKGIVIKSEAVINDLKHWKWEGGYKYSYIETISEPLFLRKENNMLVVDGGRTNYFKYSDRIHALYTMTSRNFKALSLQAGLRMEAAEGNGYQRINDSSFTRRWINLFPSLSIKRDVSKNYQFVINYSRKIKRPTSANLNPFTYFTDSLYSNSGNPFLQPQYSHTFEIRNIIRSKYSFVISYNRIKDFIVTVVYHDPVFKNILVRQQNFQRYSALSGSFITSFQPTKKWLMNISASAGINEARGQVFSQRVNESAVYFSVSMNNSVTFNKGWSADINTNYSSPQLSGLFVITRPLNYSLGVRKNLPDNRGTVSFSTASPLFIPHYRFDADYATTNYNSRFSNAAQNYKLTLNIKLGKQTVSQQRAKKNAAEEEQSRM